ncbi:MAG: leucine-rich repeat domain-containing protein, partial [Muribaculaceae bacterium]|nr:leucine-rich repeat domain-containing protein [Muribaculaceae bacterium]
NLTYNFGCQVNEATVKDGNLIRLATYYNNKNLQLVGADAPGVSDRLSARGNQVTYHNVNMPESVNGAKIEGAATQVVRGMPFTVKVTPVSPTDRVTLAVNGVNKAVSQTVANVTIPSVTEDLDITIQIKAAGASDYVVVNIKEGELAEKIAECPSRLKLVGTMHVDDFSALRAKASVLLDLDLSDVTIKGAMMSGNTIPENAFVNTSMAGTAALRTIILPSNLERISDNAFSRCIALTQISIPAKVNYVGSGAFASCTALKKIIMEGSTPPATGNMTPLPSNTSGITLEVPKGAETAYANSTYWNVISPQVATTYYWMKYDPSRTASGTASYDLNKLNPAAGNVSFSMCFPNRAQFPKMEGIYRRGVIFRVYDNGTEIIPRDAAATASSGGYYMFNYKLNVPETSVDYARNHTLEVEYYYPINFNCLDGAEGVTATIINIEGNDRYDAPMSRFVYGDSSRKTGYKEHKEFKFTLEAPEGSNLTYSVVAESKIQTKYETQNSAAEFETVTTELNPDANGIYTLPALEGDTEVLISASVVIEEGDAVKSDVLASVNKEDVEEFTELAVTGELDVEQFEAIREKFEAVETLDLSQIENEVIPANAFAGMESLNTVIIPETVTEIGAGAFAGCENIESITLPGVNSIGEGAFEGCTSLTSILIPSSDGTGAAAPAGAPRKITRSGSGISAESFRGLNPNCLIYIGENEIPESESLNIILNKGGNRVAASDITLDGNHAFNAPASFLLGDHKISFTADVTASEGCDVEDGWMTVMLPFTPTDMVIGEEFDAREGSGVHFVTFANEEDEVLTSPTEMLPNRPYLANVSAPFASVPVTFTASAREQVEGEAVVYDVPFTPVPEETVAVGKEFSLYGS